jgi:4-alpha-glucanotransferase
MKKINFVFGIHNHQPVGNFDSVFEEAYQKSYLPFLELVEKHPKIKIAYHNTGILYDWLETNHPEFIQKIQSLVQKGQLELLTGGFYEPILSVIPDEDKVGQILKHKNYLKERFNYEAKGLWLAERIWEQHLVKSIKEAGVDFIVIDDTHFKYAGFNDNDLNGYYNTEEQGNIVRIFPIKKKLRYTIPFRMIYESIDYLRLLANEDGNNIAVVADDGEKFGLWPETYRSVYEEKWLDNFFTEIENNLDWINMVHFSDILKKIEPSGLVYLPNASYSEMMHWSLPSSDSYMQYDRFETALKERNLFEDYNQFVRGGFWRNFMAKYPESNHIHKKMLRVSKRGNKLRAAGKIDNKIMDKVWMSQCNCPYWHGVFGGIYLPNLRYPIYHNLIEAEKEMDKAENADHIKFETCDFNIDGKDEIIAESKNFNLYFYPATGGALYELDYKPISFNLLDIISRREEGSHQKMIEAIHSGKLRAKETGLENSLYYDWYRHGSFLDHFFGDEADPDTVYRCQYPELGDFINQPYKFSTEKEKIILQRDGSILYDGERYPITVKKEITIKDKENIIKANYSIINKGSKKGIKIRFGIEFCFGLLAGNAHDRYYHFPGKGFENQRLNSKGETYKCKSIHLIDEWQKLKIELTTDKESTIWRFPIETVTMDVDLFEKVYQASVVIPNWEIEPDKEVKFEIELKLSQI